MPVAEAAVTQWAFTYQLTEESDAYEWLNRQFSTGAYSYLVGQVERAPTTGQLHIQGYAQTAKRMRLAGMKKLDSCCHWEHARTPAQARAYAMKEDTRVSGPWEFGDARLPGRKPTLQEACALVLEGKTDYEISRVAPEQFVRHYRGIQALRIAARIPTEKRIWEPELWVIWGKTGSGKSWFAQLNWGRCDTVFWKMQGNRWWDGYFGQETVVLDDFKGNWMSLADFQRLADRYPLTVETKGGSVEMLARRIVVTSNTHPNTWYAQDEGSVLRRVHNYAKGRFIHALSLEDWRTSSDGEFGVEEPTWYAPPGIRVPGLADVVRLQSSPEPSSNP